MTSGLDGDGWKIAEARAESYPYQIRFREFGAKFNRANFPHRLNIFWSMSEWDDRGYPTQPELARLHAFENGLVSSVETDDLAVLAMVVTGRHEREFVFYVRDSQEFVRRLSQMPQEADRYPIKIHKNDDSRWEYYETELSAIQHKRD